MKNKSRPLSVYRLGENAKRLIKKHYVFGFRYSLKTNPQDKRGNQLNDDCN